MDARTEMIANIISYVLIVLEIVLCRFLLKKHYKKTNSEEYQLKCKRLTWKGKMLVTFISSVIVGLMAFGVKAALIIENGSGRVGKFWVVDERFRNMLTWIGNAFSIIAVILFLLFTLSVWQRIMQPYKYKDDVGFTYRIIDLLSPEERKAKEELFAKKAEEQKGK